ncbi:MAG TPA: tetratricopeptide repeat protein [Terriglobales bacterium]|nr:tetratricopeptide repeat protein [Terriglobales bacterium]
MAFGFGFNKQKVLSAAEKFVQQAKLQNAISEYEKILKHDSKDLTVLNTIGDLYSRLGESDKAAECFKSVGDAYATQGFTVKAIAMYKKLSKLKASMECVLRLAELYTQQGLFNDARAQYLLVAEDFLKSGQLDQAVRIFEKTLEMDPENVSMRSKLAEVYVRLGKKEEAWKILSAAAETLRTKGQLAAADEILERMLKLDPGSSYVLVLRGRALLDAGDAKAAIESLKKVGDLDSNPEGLRALFQAYLRTKQFEDAGSLAVKLASVHNDGAAISEYSEALMEAQQYRDALAVYQQHADELLRNDPTKLSESLRAIIAHVQDDPEALATVLSLFQKTGENTHLSEIYELMAHAYVQSGDLEKARDCYLKLMQAEPANQIHVQNYQQVLDKLGNPDAPREITPEEGSALIDELEATAPFIEQRYDDEVALAVRSALTDAELFTSYNMAQKALPPLLQALPKAPRDLRLNQKLLGLHTRAGRFTEAAVCCRTLESIYHDGGYSEEASRYGDLAAKYEQRGSKAAPSTSSGPSAVQELQVSAAAPEFEISAPQSETLAAADQQLSADVAEMPASQPSMPTGVFFHASSTVANSQTTTIESAQEPESAAIAPQEQAAEVDLSADWESAFSVEAPQPEEIPVEQPVMVEAFAPAIAQAEPEAAPPTVDLGDGIEEVRFYLGQGMTDHAENALAKLEALAPGSPELAVLRLGIESAKQQAIAQAPEIQVEAPAPTPSTDFAYEAHAAAPQPWPQEKPHAPAERPALQEMVSEIEQSLGDGFLGQSTPAEISAPAPAPEQTTDQQFRSGTLDDFVSDLESALGSDFMPEAPVEQAAVAHAQTTAADVPAPLARAAAASAVSSHVAPPLTPQIVIGSSSSVESTGVDLANMFGELKQELEEGGTSSDEDPETHYNLGVAFREMGLLDEAIGEFQKVCQAADHGRAFSQLMQTYTWLAQCFLDKGVPEAAIRWYEQALKLPSLDQETRTALHYELASSFENAGNKPAALTNFLEVYGSNIDYRDVGERIKALR